MAADDGQAAAQVNDDAGQMSAWYIFSSLGLYPLCPGSTHYAVGSPLVESATLHLENGNTVRIEARDQSPENVFVERVELDGHPIPRRYLTHDDLVAGGSVTFFMGPQPNRDW